jgi:hypothetical protein
LSVHDKPVLLLLKCLFGRLHLEFIAANFCALLQIAEVVPRSTAAAVLIRYARVTSRLVAIACFHDVALAGITWFVTEVGCTVEIPYWMMNSSAYLDRDSTRLSVAHPRHRHCPVVRCTQSHDRTRSQCRTLAARSAAIVVDLADTGRDSLYMHVRTHQPVCPTWTHGLTLRLCHEVVLIAAYTLVYKRNTLVGVTIIEVSIARDATEWLTGVARLCACITCTHVGEHNNNTPSPTIGQHTTVE